MKKLANEFFGPSGNSMDYTIAGDMGQGNRAESKVLIRRLVSTSHSYRHVTGEKTSTEFERANR